MKVLLKGILLAALLTTPALANPPQQDQPDPRWLRQAQQPGIPPLRKKAYEQLALFRTQRGYGAPQNTLLHIGLEALPALAEAIDDATPTYIQKISYEVRVGGGDYQHRATVSEVVIPLIEQIAQRPFVSYEGVRQHPELVPVFKANIVNWYKRNHLKTLAQRKTDDISDPGLSTRLEAIEWLGRNQVRASKGVLENHIASCLARPTVDTATDAELASAALALGQIGDKAALPTIQRVYQRFRKYSTSQNQLSYYRGYIAPEDMPKVRRAFTLLGATPPS